MKKRADQHTFALVKKIVISDGLMKANAGQAGALAHAREIRDQRYIDVYME